MSHTIYCVNGNIKRPACACLYVHTTSRLLNFITLFMLYIFKVGRCHFNFVPKVQPQRLMCKFIWQKALKLLAKPLAGKTKPLCGRARKSLENHNEQV